MNEVLDEEIMRIAGGLLFDSPLDGAAHLRRMIAENQCTPIASDGSTRRFWRVNVESNRGCVIAAPGEAGPEGLAESRAAWQIGNHLFKKGVGVPELYGWDAKTGVLLFEDLGDTRLQNMADKVFEGDDRGWQDEKTLDYYRAAIENLVLMQCRGGQGFDASWCWDTPRYDSGLMLEKESGYFLRAFWQGLLGQDVAGGVEEELEDIARIAGEIPADFFLHRDYQSRNIMIKQGRVRTIDYQGGRFGPLAYDLASLLIDPYGNLTLQVQERLFDYYFDTLAKHLTIEKKTFRKQFDLLAFQRNVQIIGAFSFLHAVRGKPFFKAFIRPALLSLDQRMQNELFADYPLFKAMVQWAVRQYALHEAR